MKCPQIEEQNEKHHVINVKVKPDLGGPVNGSHGGDQNKDNRPFISVQHGCEKKSSQEEDQFVEEEGKIEEMVIITVFQIWGKWIEKIIEQTVLDDKPYVRYGSFCHEGKPERDFSVDDQVIEERILQLHILQGIVAQGDSC